MAAYPEAGEERRNMSIEPARDPFVAEPHDHGRCIHAAVAQAADLCASRGVRLTDLRRQVLELVWQSHAPVGAYQLLEQLAGTRGRVAPPTVYRALEFLTREGLVHRIDSLNAYVGCPSPDLPHQAYFFICRACGDAAEFHDAELSASLGRCVQRARFHVEAATVELSGLCARCVGKEAAG
jgi:Fur family zinc uptake transcriptional regulator